MYFDIVLRYDCRRNVVNRSSISRFSNCISTERLRAQHSLNLIKHSQLDLPTTSKVVFRAQDLC